MSLFSSETPLSQYGFAENDNNLSKASSGGGLLSSIGLGLGIAGAALGARFYKQNPAVRLQFAQSVSKFFGASATNVARNNQGIFKEQFVGAASDLAIIAKNIKNIPANRALDAVEALRAVTTPRYQPETHATVFDLLSQLGTANQKAASELRGHLETIASRAKGSGISADDIARQTYLGENILREGGEIADYRRFTPEGLVQRGLEYSHENLKFPVIGFSPTDIFLHHAWSHTSNVAVLGSESAIRGQKLNQKGLVVGKTAFTEGGQAIKGNWKLFSTTSSLAESAAIVSNQYKVRPLHELIDEGSHGSFSKWFMSQQQKVKLASMPDEQAAALRQKIKDVEDKWAGLPRKVYSRKHLWDDINEIHKEFGEAGPLGEDFFLSPKYTRSGSMLEQSFDWLGRVAGGDAVQTQDAAGKFIRDLDTDPLNLIERIKLRAKGDVRGFHYGAAEVAEEGAESFTTGGGGKWGPKKIGGFQDFIPGVHDPEKIVRSFEDYETRPQVANQFIATEGGDSLFSNLFTSDAGKSFWHFQARRPSKLLEGLTGFGIRPESSVLKTMLLGTVGTYAAFEIVKNSMSYFNFLTLGLPAKALGVATGAAQMGGQALMTATGIGPVSDFMEENFPGSVNSFGSELLRTIAAPFAGAAIGGAILPKAIKVPGILSRMIPSQAGEGVMSGRAVGAFAATALALTTDILDPTKGVSEQWDEVTGQKRVAVRNARWWVAGRAPYGGDYIKYYEDSLPQKLWHHGAGDKTTYGSEAAKWGHSWFPTPSNLFGIRPLLDPYYVDRLNQDARPYPVVDSVGGNLPVFGPAFQATVGEILKPRIQYDVDNPNTRRGHYGSGVLDEGARLGFDTPVPELDARSPGSAGSIAHHTISKLQDYLGVYGFASKFLTNPLLGSDTGFGGGFELEGSSRMTNQGEALREANLGGMMGHTEYLRRLYNDRSRSVNYSNPIPNISPQWLPGSNSSNPEDRTFSMDFHTGDPYTKIEHGDVRLPGPGYEALHGYHGGKQPDIIDAWAILSDVAPGSQTRKDYEKTLDTMYLQGNLDKAGVKIYERVKSEAAERLGGRYNFKDTMVSTVNHPGPASQETNRYLSYLNMNMAETPANPVLAPFQGAWNTFTHARVPGLAWAQGKFMHNRTPLEEYKASQVHGTDFANWQDPFSGFIRPAHTEIMGAIFGSHYRPWEVQKKDEIDEYYDKLKYLKAKRLQQLASTSGEGQLKTEYGRQQKQTVVGMEYGVGALNRNIFAALPSNMRSFVGGFANATESESEKIRKYVPAYQRQMWDNIWAVNQGGGGQGGGALPLGESTKDQEVAEYFARHALPSPTSNVWNPDVSLDEYRIKTAEHAGVSYWTMGIPEAQAREYRSLGRAEVVIDTSPFSGDNEVRNKLMTELNVAGATGTVNMSNVRQTQMVGYNTNRRDEKYANKHTGRF